MEENCSLGAYFIEKYDFWPLFLTEITVKIKNHGHIRDQQVKIYKNPWFNFDFTSLEFLTVFSTAILTGSWWRKKLQPIRKPRVSLDFSNFQFWEHSEENCSLGAYFIEKYDFWPLFLTEITVKIKNHGYIRDQQVKIYKNPCFVFDFTSLEFLTVFSTAIWTGSWWRRLLKWNRKPSFNSIYSNFQFQENRIKTVAVTVPSWLMEHMTVVTSSNMLMS